MTFLLKIFSLTLHIRLYQKSETFIKTVVLNKTIKHYVYLNIFEEYSSMVIEN